ncbi:uncharacterized protein LOC143140170 [Alosa pseudoharengus]|uniref:uncharacterized protein LOC143140170 n=1 Tax=Alosa pseudoharengus TaxID=34774 RepID=UPI003F88D76D
MAEEGHSIKPDEPYRALFKELAKATPACALFHLGPEMEGIIKCLMTEDNVTQLSSVMKALAEQCPLWWTIITTLGHFPPHLRPLLEEVWRVAKAPFQQVAEEDIMEPNAGDVDDAVFPFLPILRARGVYEADIRRKKERSCKKISPRHFALIPGIFTVLCKHGVCYGYAVMESPESVDLPFTALKTRWLTAPDVIIYDNACKLHSFRLNRDPAFFQRSWFLIDRLHWRNHKGCSVGYNADSYPQLSGINTQQAEQFNARLKRLKHHLPYMTREHFLQHLRLYVWYHSRVRAQQTVK